MQSVPIIMEIMILPGAQPIPDMPAIHRVLAIPGAQPIPDMPAIHRVLAIPGAQPVPDRPGNGFSPMPTRSACVSGRPSPWVRRGAVARR
jgi:hypothetical protein